MKITDNKLEQYMDLIQILKERVIPIVLNNQTTLLSEKSTVLATFLPILLSILKSKPELISSLQTNLNPRLADLFPSDGFAKENLLGAIQQDLPKDEAETLLSKSIAPTLGALEDLAGTNDDRGILHYLEQYKDSIGAALPLWATSILAGLGVGAFTSNAVADTSPVITPSHVAPVTPLQRAEHEPVKEKSGYLLPLLGLLILGLLVALFLRYCNNKEQTAAADQVAAVSSVAVAQPALFQLTTDASGSLVTCQAKIGNLSFVESIQAEIKQLFTHANGCGVDSSTAYNAELVDQNALSSVLKLLKGVPNIDLNWTGNEILLKGADATTTKALADKIQALVPNLTVKTNAALDVNTAVNTSISDAEKALSSINPDQVKPLDIATALNIQIINFATGSNEIPDANKSVLDQAAVLMNRVPNVQLKVKGFTDATGNVESNKTLSHKRAQAVVDYLVSKGADPSKLSAVGLGQENPIADNSTEEGKFKNRRIEFEVTNTETGVQRTVDDQGVVEKK